MFDPFVGGHDTILTQLLQVRDRLSPSDVTAGFIVSLSTRRLDLRSALGSYSVVRNLSQHPWQKMPEVFPYCSICGDYSESSKSHDLNVLSFERHKWGGFRHSSPTYTFFDLEQFSRDLSNTPKEEDFSILRNILITANSMPRDAKLADLVKAIAGIFPSNVSERRSLIEILGHAGVLENPQHPGFFYNYQHFCDRERTPWYKDDWAYPVMWWKGVNRVNKDAVSFWFSEIADSLY